MARDTKVDTFMPLFVGDYLADTGHLSCEEDGAYLRILMHMWRRGGLLAFDHNQLATMCKLTRRRWDAVWRTLAPFFEVRDGFIMQGRLCHEVAIALAKKEEASRAGKASAEARRVKNGTAQPSGPRTDVRTEPERTFERMLEQNPNSSSSSPSSSEDNPPTACDPSATEPEHDTHMEVPITGPYLAQVFGAIRSDTIGGIAWHAQAVGAENAANKAAIIAGTPGARKHLAASMRRFWESVRDGMHPKATEVQSKPSLALGCWFSDWHGHLEEFTGQRPKVAPSRVAARGSPLPPDPYANLPRTTATGVRR